MKDATSCILCEIEAERIRQIEVEGFTSAHDDTHDVRNLARAAEAYVSHYAGRTWVVGDKDLGLETYQAEEPPDAWPWEPELWKPKNPRRDLIRAIALLVAEVERIDRQSPGSADAPHE